MKLFYDGIERLGQHYLVQQINNVSEVVGHARHYSVANCMRKNVYEAYVNALNGNEIETSIITKKSKEDSDLVLTIKAYKEANGLSQKIASAHSSKFGIELKVMGPMGKGLCPNYSGLHIGFSAGTGVLFFMDLVAYLTRQEMSIPGIDESQDKLLGADFKFILYASFANEEEAVGLELLRAANEKLGKRFQLKLRLSSQTSQRWDINFLDKEFSQL